MTWIGASKACQMKRKRKGPGVSRERSTLESAYAEKRKTTTAPRERRVARSNNSGGGAEDMFGSDWSLFG